MDDHITKSKLSEIYDDKMDEKISQHIYLHAELNILAKIVDQKYKTRLFIAVSLVEIRQFRNMTNADTH